VELESIELSLGDVAVINGYRAVFDHLVATRGAKVSRLQLAEEG
jgi:hypothetical protein